MHGGYPCDPDKRVLLLGLDALMQKVRPWLAKIFKGNVMSKSPIVVKDFMYSMSPDDDFIIDFFPLTKIEMSIVAK